MTAAETAATTSGKPLSVSGDEPFVRAAQDYAERVLRPSALRTDQAGVTEQRIRELRELGLLTLTADPAGYGALGRGAARRVHEAIAGGCFNTWLVWAQHASAAETLRKALAASGHVPELARKILSGEYLLGAGISDVRGYPARYIEAAAAADGGWTFSGTISWVSGWGLNSVLAVAAVEPATEAVVTALVEVGERTRLAAHLSLAAVAGSRTERVALDHAFVPREHVLSVKPLGQVRFDDIAIASDARGHHFGLAETVLRELGESPDPLAQAVAVTWRPRVAQLRETAYALADEALAAGGGRHRIEERLAAKVAAGEALAVLTRALVAARSGRGLADTDTAQLHARSALFTLVQGQNQDVRRAQLAHLAR